MAGVVNTAAGGGSLITVPTLIFLGLPSAVANGTNRVAIEVESIVAILGFRSKGLSDFKLSFQFAAPALVGAIVGARIAVDISDILYRRILAGVMIVVLVLILLRPTRHLGESKRLPVRPRRLIALAAFFFAGVYGGFIQAGVGFILIATLVALTGMDLVKVNSHKVFIVAIYTFFALGVFVLEGKVDWFAGAVLAVGNGTGGWIGSRIQVDKGEQWIRVILVISVLAMAVRLSGLIPAWS